MSRGGSRRNKEDEKMVNGVLNGGRRVGDGGGKMPDSPGKIGENGGVKMGEGGVTGSKMGEGSGGGSSGGKVGDGCDVVDEGKDGDGGGGRVGGGQRMRGYIVDTRSSAIMKMDVVKGGLGGRLNGFHQTLSYLFNLFLSL